MHWRNGESNRKRGRKEYFMKKMLCICIDGCSPEYIENKYLPNIQDIAKQGFYKYGSSVIPSVTNVNNISIVTGRFPVKHGITSNYYYNPEKDLFEYMESADYLLTDTVFERAKRKGLSTAVLTSKSKLLHLLKKGADIAFSIENPPSEYVNALGAPPGIYSADINVWLLNAALYLIKKQSPDILYVSTTDYPMHKYAPDDEPSISHMRELDKVIGDICTQEPNREIYITADHGMNAKHQAVNIRIILNKQGIDSIVVPIIKDRYTLHHQNLGGAAYVYLKNKNKEKLKEAMTILNASGYIDEVYTDIDAVKIFNLYPMRIGDLFVLAKKDIVFGDINAMEEPVNIRSHGSRHESLIPIISNQKLSDKYNYNLDIFAGV
jgi:phosphonoacetate hydrolase